MTLPLVGPLLDNTILILILKVVFFVSSDKTYQHFINEELF